MRAAWAKAGITAQDLIAVGEAARQAERYEEALGWYERAMWVEPGLGDPWYYVGLVHEEQRLRLQALESYKCAISIDHFQLVHRSSVHYRSGEILGSQQVEFALREYELAIKINDFKTDWEAANSHYKRGNILRRLGASPEMVVAEYERAIDIYPEHVWAYSRLGEIYEQEGRVEEAIVAYKRALSIDPDFGQLREKLDDLD
jgi:superkiller protein 3